MAGDVAPRAWRCDPWVWSAETEALHALTTGSIGVMTLAVMTRASLGHTGRPRYAGPVTVFIYILVNLGAMLRVFGPTRLFRTLVLGLAAASWSGAYLLFVADLWTVSPVPESRRVTGRIADITRAVSFPHSIS